MKHDDIKTLQQYLWMDKRNRIQIRNAFHAPLELQMDEQGRCWCTNLRFPTVYPKSDWSNLPIETWYRIIDDLKQTPAVQLVNVCNNRWEEIKVLIYLHELRKQEERR